MNAPLCFASPSLFELWLKSDLALPKPNRCGTPCTDCTPAYQLRMKKLGRCAHPETQFSMRDGAVYGYWPS